MKKTRIVISVLIVFVMLLVCFQKQSKVILSDDSTKIKKISIGFYNTAVITGNNDLYIWGTGYKYASGNGDSREVYSPTRILRNVKDVSLGGYNGVAVSEDGTLYAWGDLFGTTYQRPTKILSDITQASMSANHCVALSENGSMYCWGYNSAGQIGDGTTEKATTPKIVMENIKRVSAGSETTAAITNNGELYCWGTKYLGDGQTTGSKVPKKIMDDVSDIDLSDGYDNQYFRAAVKNNGDLYMWGDNYFGELGNNSTSNITTPTKIMSNVSNISLGGNHSAAITDVGELWYWGANDYGQLGDSTYESRIQPTKIASGIKSVENGSVSSGYIDNNGDMFLFGSNYSSRLIWNVERKNLVPTKIMNNVKSISFSSGISTAIDNNNQMYIWGRLSSKRESRFYARKTPKAMYSDIKYIDAYSNYIATIKNDIKLYGLEYSQQTNGDYGFIFDEKMKDVQKVSVYSKEMLVIDKQNCLWNYADRNKAAEKIINPIELENNVQDAIVSTSGKALITKTGDLYCWGSNNYGQIGDGSNVSSDTPIKVMGNIKQVALGNMHAAAITNDGELYCWGLNNTGQIGDGTTQSRNIPIKVLDNVKKVECGYQATVAILNNGDMYAWGYNGWGLAGDQTTNTYYVPHKTLSMIKDVDMGYDHIGVINSRDELYCWGSTQYGQVGDGIAQYENKPVKMQIGSFEPTTQTPTTKVPNPTLQPETTQTPTTKGSIKPTTHQITTKKTPMQKQSIYIKILKNILYNKSFYLDARTSGNGKLNYKSSDANVATVSPNGLVKTHGCGSVKITITASKTKNYYAAKKELLLNVKPKKSTVPRLKSLRKNALIISWRVNKKMDGYVLQLCKSKKFKKSVFQKSFSKNRKKVTVKFANQSHKKYYVRMKYFKKTNGIIYYGKWSKIVYKKIK